MVASRSHNNREKSKRRKGASHMGQIGAKGGIKSHNKKGEEQEKERRQPNGQNWREWSQAKATTSRQKSRRRKGTSPMGQIGANSGK